MRGITREKPWSLGLASAALLTLVVACTSGSPKRSPKTYDLTFGEVVVRAELACTPAERQRGLMFRKSLAADGGMLFVFPEPKKPAFWMKNTRVPLDIAYIGSNGRILQISRLRPYSRKLVRSRFVVKYALEVRRGFFGAHKIKVGAQMALPKELKSLKAT
jgi:uncharacterized membrane protein (UPF0127 family)